jgi:predicted deacylase
VVGRRTAKKAERPAEPFLFEGESVAPGTRHEFSIPIARLPAGTWVNMPVVVLHGVRAGPVVWANGAIHGDELNGVEIVRQLLFQIDPQALAGTFLGVPIVNAFGVTAASRYLPDRKDLNRAFPGSPRGSLAARLAHAFFDRVVCRAELGMDFHTGSAGRTNLPHIRCTTKDAQTLRLARAFGASLVLDSPQRTGSLRAEAVRRGIRVLLFEGGEAERLDPDAIAAGCDGALRVLAAMGMLGSAPASPFPDPAICTSSLWTRATRSGFCRMAVELGQRVEPKEPLAVVHDAVGPGEQVVRARTGGVVIGLLRTAVVHRGDSIVHVGVPQSR